jgi:peptidyl-tRNA hydrolase
MIDWVLSKISKEDLELCQKALNHIPDLVETLLTQGLDATRSRFNGPLL